MALSPSASYKSHYQNFTPPFDIPTSWEWVRLEDICFVITDGDHQAPPKANDGIPFLVISDIITGIIKFDKCRYVPVEYYSNLETYRKPSKGDILFTVTGSYGKSVIVETDKRFCFQRHIGLIKPILITKYLNIVLCSEYIKKECDAKATGTAQKTVGLESLRNFYIPIPPLSEQLRIIDQCQICEELLIKIDVGKKLLGALIEASKSKILDLAMQGKLVPQDPADEPATDMLRRINPNAKIITDNPHSWNIPNGWCWVMVSDVFAPMQRKLPEGDNFWYIDIDSVDNKRNVAYPKNICTTTAPSRASRFTQKGDVVFSMVRPYLRNIALVPEDDCIASTGFYVFHPLDAILSKYSYILTLSSFFVDGLNSFMKGDNSPSINKNNVESFVIPLPPLNEQKRIVAKIEDLYSVLDEIEASLRS